MKKSFKGELFSRTGGVKLHRINYITMFLVVCLCVFVLFISHKIRLEYNGVVSSMNDYTECSKAINDFKETSDYLTNQVRLFVAKFELAYLENYCFELKDIRRRETAVQIVEMTHKGDVADMVLLQALGESDILSKTELYAMKLICNARGVDNSKLPEIVAGVSLSEEDLALENQAKMIKAVNMLYDSDYISAKNRIHNYVSSALNSLVNDYVSFEQGTDKGIRKLLLRLKIHIVILLFISLFLFVSLTTLIFSPLFEYVDRIEKGLKIKFKGCYELRYIAAAYNKLCDKNALEASDLKHKAEHDPLTGLINRSAFNTIKDAYRDSGDPIAYLLIDIDFFKSINDEYGHVVGDKVLKLISGLLQEQFRMTDYVARIGGDEFAVIMTKFGEAPEKIISEKIQRLNEKLQVLEEGLPSVSLSVGVAFSEDGYNDTLVEYADSALYKVKRGGRCNCSFYNSCDKGDK